ncbi:MAG: TIR domain-containing protein [Candidatus Helarchaeota archaeon]
MSYRNKTYVCFDADNDMHWYTLMLAWKENEQIAFNFHNAHEINNLRDGSPEETIKRKLRERLQNTKVLVVLIGDHTKNLFKYVRWEIEYAIEKDIPIIGVNLNKKKRRDNDLCPPLLKDELAIHIPYGQKIMDHALNNWPESHRKYRNDGKTGPYYYLDSVYSDLGI